MLYRVCECLNILTFMSIVFFWSFLGLDKRGVDLGDGLNMRADLVEDIFVVCLKSSQETLNYRLWRTAVEMSLSVSGWHSEKEEGLRSAGTWILKRWRHRKGTTVSTAGTVVEVKEWEMDCERKSRSRREREMS
jgi:hypothetical protein